MDALNQLKYEIIKSFMIYQVTLESGRKMKDYEYIKESIDLENWIVQHSVSLDEANTFIQKAILNLKINDL